jgi:hypothetical protein
MDFATVGWLVGYIEERSFVVGAVVEESAQTWAKAEVVDGYGPQKEWRRPIAVVEVA